MFETNMFLVQVQPTMFQTCFKRRSFKLACVASMFGTHERPDFQCVANVFETVNCPECVSNDAERTKLQNEPFNHFFQKNHSHSKIIYITK